ncbi:Protein CBG26445 [Caenorhabditis briggsae]|uniref:Protein CBG26445 n=1 Tax=Caenorhabditis briggsae TaxID=6238 RepID=B6IEY2_CAEBR|nr:Protein CBG26445 [Caenorhabditis briggsae]CAR98462.1 Protein CBG26445 [Caenorhabditis briggsae]
MPRRQKDVEREALQMDYHFEHHRQNSYRYSIYAGLLCTFPFLILFALFFYFFWFGRR